MSLYQCERCGCRENTALAMQPDPNFYVQIFDWTGVEDRKSKRLCSACMPHKYSDGTDVHKSEQGWHNRFKRVFLPLGMFKTNRVGNLEHKETGDENVRKYECASPEGLDIS